MNAIESIPHDHAPAATESRRLARPSSYKVHASIILLCLVFCTMMWGGLYMYFSIERERIIESKGMRAGCIAIRVNELPQGLLLRYADDGKGIAPEHLGKIFDPFFTTKRGQGGSGLGMHIVYNLVTQTLGGTISCKSTPGHGVIFEIEIPLPQPAPETTALLDAASAHT